MKAEELHESGLAHKAPTLVSAERMSAVELAAAFDYVWAFSVLIHMTDEILGETLRFVRLHLKDIGSFYANLNIGIRPDGRWQAFPLVWQPLPFYQEACRQAGLKLSEVSQLSELGPVTRPESPLSQRMFLMWKA